MDSEAARPRSPSAWPLLLALAPWAWLSWSFRWACDDAYISYRYARHLAAGEGLRFNLGEGTPVEGYTNFLWVVWTSLFERLGVEEVAVAAGLSSAACGVLLLWWLSRALQRRLGLSATSSAGAALFLATLPPLAVWSTGGLETLPFALFVFLAWERLLADPERPHPLAAGTFLAGACLLRADGAWWAGLVIVAGLLSALGLPERRALRRAALLAAIVPALAVAGHLAFRLGYYGDWLPNTARAKVGLSGSSFLRGLQYVGTSLVVFPSVVLALVLAWGPVRRGRRGPAFTAALMVLGTFLHSVLVGGDFMCMGRFLIPALPFAALLFGCALEGLSAPGSSPWRRRLLPAGLVALCAYLSLLPAADLHLAPRVLRERLYCRWSDRHYASELTVWKRMRQHTEDWSRLGRALGIHAQPGESIVQSGVGCIGYYSGLFVYDTHGLVSRKVATGRAGRKRGSAGHDLGPDPSFRRESRPTFFAAEIVRLREVPVDDPGRGLMARTLRKYDAAVHALSEEDGFEEGLGLRVLRYRPR